MNMTDRRPRFGLSTQSIVALLAAGAATVAFTYLLGTIVGSQQSRFDSTQASTVDPTANRVSTTSDGRNDAPKESATSASQPPLEPQEQRAPSSPPIVVDPPVLDLGVVGYDRKVSATAHLRNTSDKPLRIVTHRQSCECAAADVPHHDIPPHGAVPVTITFDTTRRRGKQSASVRVLFQDYDEVVDVVLNLEVAEGVRIEPAMINALSEMRGFFVIESLDGTPFEVLTFGGRPPVFVGFDPMNDHPQSRYEIAWDVSDVDLVSCKDSTGRRLPGWFAIETTHPEALVRDVHFVHACTMPTRRIGHDRWIIGERRVTMTDLAPGDSGEYTTRVVWPSHVRPNDRVAAVESESDLFEAELISQQQGPQGTELLVRVTPAPGVRGVFQGEVRYDSEGGKSDWTMVIGRVRSN